MSTQNPILALTMGDPAGVGPEIIAGAWPSLFSCGDLGISACRPVVFGCPEIIRRAAALRKISAKIIPINDSFEMVCNDYFKYFGPDRIPCLKCCDDEVLDTPDGQIDRRAGQAAFDSLNCAIDFALAKRVAAIVTAPLNKKSLNLAGHHYPGHTEILAARCGVTDYAMMLYLGHQENVASPTGLAVVHVTLHTAMRNVFDQLTPESVYDKCVLVRDFMFKMKGSEPRIGVCALNCHNGEDGLFGTEEIEIIRPAVERARRAGMSVEGPFPSDTLMVDAKNGKYDGIVAMIHDQGHIAVKLLGMHKAVNVTLGLPIVRTSVAHGTAFDLAWRGIAETSSMIEAVRVALRLG